jgi:hypothetical protein
MKNSLKKAGEKVAKFASQQDTNIQMALNKVEQILSRIKGGIPSSMDANIPEWFDKTLANALPKQPQNGNGRVATMNGIFKLLATIYDKYFLDEDGYAVKIVKKHVQTNRVKREDAVSIIMGKNLLYSYSLK